MPEKLKCFLYLLMRDELPCGVIARIVKDLPGKTRLTYSNEGLARYAEEVMQELLIGKKEPK